MDLNLTNRIALVTGGSRGMGRSIAFTLAREGAEISICARGKEDLEKTAQAIRSQMGQRCLPIQADLSIAEECGRFVRDTIDHFGRADILVCCANELVKTFGTFFTITDVQWHSHMHLKFFSAVRLAKAVVPHMQKNKWGRIILVSGMASRSVRPMGMDHGPVCAALTNFGKQLGAQVIGDGIRVNTIHPDVTRNQLLMTILENEANERKISIEEAEKEKVATLKLPLGRFLEPKEIAYLVAFLSSDLADAITGQSIAVDGGAAMSIHY